MISSNDRLPATRARVHLGIVHGADGIHFVAAGETRDALLQRLAGYVWSHADLELYPDDARRLDRLLKTGAAEDAVRFYFDRVGQKWDREWLVEGVMPVAEHRSRPGDDAASGEPAYDGLVGTAAGDLALDPRPAEPASRPAPSGADPASRR
jgi:hypothetical protein